MLVAITVLLSIITVILIFVSIFLILLINNTIEVIETSNYLNAMVEKYLISIGIKLKGGK